MSKTSQLPQAIRSILPSTDGNSEYVEGTDGRILVAGTYAVFLIEGEQLGSSGMWYQVQYAKWDALSREFTLVWVDPQIEPLKMVTVEENPSKFMKLLTSRVDKTIVLSRQIETSSGAIVTASVRRRIDGALFSSVITQGKLLPNETELVNELEKQVRMEVNLED